MSVKQSLRGEDFAEHSYQFSCRAADWSSMSFSQVPMQFESLELHVVEALGQQDVPECFQQPAKAITEDVSVMRGPQAEEHATSTPLPARLILVTKPNVHGGPAMKKARIVICGDFQEVRLDEFTASKTPRHPSLRMALSVASHMGWPIECWDVSTAFLYEIFMRPPKILVEAGVVLPGSVWKIKKALYGLSPIAWGTERDNTLESLKWNHNAYLVMSHMSRSLRMRWLKESSPLTLTIFY